MEALLRSFQAQEYSIDLAGVSEMSSGLPPQKAVFLPAKIVDRLHGGEIRQFNRRVFGHTAVPLPFLPVQCGRKLLWDLRNPETYRYWAEGEVGYSPSLFALKGVYADLARFVALKRGIHVQRREELGMFLSGVFIPDKKLVTVIAPGHYNQARMTMNAQGVRLVVTRKELNDLAASGNGTGGKLREELVKLSKALRGRFGQVTVGEAIHKCCRGLPSFSSIGAPVVGHLMGTASLVLIRRGNEITYIVFGRRSPQRVSLATDRLSFPTSGGLVFDRERGSVLEMVRRNAVRECKEELGFHVGSEQDGTFRHVAVARDPRRAGSPEFLSVIVYDGPAEALATCVRCTEKEQRDVSALVAIPWGQQSALRTARAFSKCSSRKRRLHFV